MYHDNELGPYGDDSLWNTQSLQYIIDIIWIFRFDSYFRNSHTNMIIWFAI